MPYTVTRNSTTPSQVLTANRTYEATRNTLRSIENNAGTSVISRYTYGVNPITQRESVTTAGSAFGATQANWNWQYDSLGQVVRADQTTNTASNPKYAYDNIGNRTKSANGTTALPTANNWTSNALNQYTVARGITLPTSPAPAPYDLDGNMTTGLMPGTNGNVAGVQTPANATEIKWDAENRLISFKIGTVTYNYQYDFLSRLITRLTGSTVNARYLYDGWNRITEYTNADLQDTFTWGLDHSGSMQGAGGVGGLLATRWITVSNTDLYPTYDGNGNISEYLNATGGVTSHYEYDPFGTLTRLTGSTSTRLQYRFSTKPRDSVSGLYYYGYRWYDPLTGRWTSRDPIEERGGVNLYGFVGNDGVCSIDNMGLSSLPFYRLILVDAYMGPQGCFGCNTGAVYTSLITKWFNADIATKFRDQGIGYNDKYFYDAWIRGYKLQILNWKTVTKEECDTCKKWQIMEKAVIKMMWFKAYEGTRQEIIDNLKIRWGKDFKEEQVPEDYPDKTPPIKIGDFGLSYWSQHYPKEWVYTSLEIKGDQAIEANFRRYARERRYDLTNWTDGQCVSVSEMGVIEARHVLHDWDDTDDDL